MKKIQAIHCLPISNSPYGAKSVMVGLSEQTGSNERFYPHPRCFFPTLKVKMPRNARK